VIWLKGWQLRGSSDTLASAAGASPPHLCSEKSTCSGLPFSVLRGTSSCRHLYVSSYQDMCHLPRTHLQMSFHR
jgi:hypothetical protein